MNSDQRPEDGNTVIPLLERDLFATQRISSAVDDPELAHRFGQR